MTNLPRLRTGFKLGTVNVENRNSHLLLYRKNGHAKAASLPLKYQAFLVVYRTLKFFGTTLSYDLKFGVKGLTLLGGSSQIASG